MALVERQRWRWEDRFQARLLISLFLSYDCLLVNLSFPVVFQQFRLMIRCLSLFWPLKSHNPFQLSVWLARFILSEKCMALNQNKKNEKESIDKLRVA
jgi:hypothetical protein